MLFLWLFFCVSNSEAVCTGCACFSNCPSQKVDPDGTFRQRPDCCETWYTPDFQYWPSLFSQTFGERVQLYSKDVLSKRMVVYSPLTVPLLSFNGLPIFNASGPLYDNTTCAGRCCKQTVVWKDPAQCGAEWTKCAVVNESPRVPSCSVVQQQGGWRNCSAWVPCDPYDRTSFWTSWCILLLLSAVFCAPTVWMSSTNMITAAYTVAFIFIATPSMIVMSDVSQWESASSAIDKKFISYQSCVSYCNSLLGDTNIVKNRFCGDLNRPQVYSVFDADFNGFLTNTSNLDGEYCKSCYDHIDDWKSLQSIAQFLGLKALILWITIVIFHLAVLIRAYIGNKSSWFEGMFKIAIGIAAIHIVGLFISACFAIMFTVQVQYLHAVPILNDSIGMLRVDLLCASWIAFDLICMILGVCFVFYYYAYLLKWKQDNRTEGHSNIKSCLRDDDARETLVLLAAKTRRERRSNC